MRQAGRIEALSGRPNFVRPRAVARFGYDGCGLLAIIAMKTLRSFSLLVLLAAALSAKADPAITISAIASTASLTIDGTVGWTFSTAQPTRVSALGFYDLSPNDPLDADHQVGIWDGAGTLLGSTTVLTGDALADGFRYHSLGSSILLPAGAYTIGAQVVARSTFYAIDATFTTSPLIAYGTPVNSFPTSGFVRPTTVLGGIGRFGPSMMLQAVPEPSALAALGLGALGIVRRRKRS